MIYDTSSCPLLFGVTFLSCMLGAACDTDDKKLRWFCEGCAKRLNAMLTRYRAQQMFTHSIHSIGVHGAPLLDAYRQGKYVVASVIFFWPCHHLEQRCFDVKCLVVGLRKHQWCPIHTCPPPLYSPGLGSDGVVIVSRCRYNRHDRQAGACQ